MYNVIINIHKKVKQLNTVYFVKRRKIAIEMMIFWEYHVCEEGEVIMLSFFGRKLMKRDVWKSDL